MSGVKRLAGFEAPLWHLGQLEGLLCIGDGSGERAWKGTGCAALATLAGNVLKRDMADIFFGIVEMIPAWVGFFPYVLWGLWREDECTIMKDSVAECVS